MPTSLLQKKHFAVTNEDEYTDKSPTFYQLQNREQGEQREVPLRLELVGLVDKMRLK